MIGRPHVTLHRGEAVVDDTQAVLPASVGLATLLNQHIGYAKAAEVAKEAAATGKTVRDLILEKGLMSEADLEAALEAKRVTEPHDSTPR